MDVSPEFVAIIAVGVSLAGLMLTVRSRIEVRLLAVEDRLLAVEKEQAHTAGLLEGLGLTGRASASVARDSGQAEAPPDLGV